MLPPRSTGTDPEAELPPQVGQYRLETRLGSGGMGVVHLARSASGLRLAVKVVHAEFAQDPEFRGRFRQEVAAARRVSGAFTAPVVDADPEADHPWMATLFIPGPTLSEHVKRNGGLPPERLRHLMAGLSEALRDIHRAGVVHRDLKPSNVLLAEDGPKVIDFGISRPSDSELRTETGKLIGTPPFMAPEQFRSPREVGPAADVFALGSLIVHAATGSGPFASDSPYLVAYQVVHEEPDLTGVPQDLAPLVTRCLAKEPEDRPTAEELMNALRSVSASYDTQAFIPQQRDRSGFRPDQRDDTTHLKIKPPESDPKAPGSRRTSRRKSLVRRLWLPAVAVLSALAGALVYVGSDEPAVGTPTAATSTSAFHGWRTELSAAGVTADGMARCVHTPRTLYCTRPGVLAAAVDAATGRVRWVRGGTAQRDSPRPPVLSGGLLHVMGRHGTRLTALDPATGTPRWTHDISPYDGRVAHAAGAVLLTGADGTVTALDAATGEEKWHRAIPGQPRPVFQSYGDGAAYAVSAAGPDTRVTAVDPETGATRWQRRLDGPQRLVGAHDGAVWLTSYDAQSYTNAVVRYDVADRKVRRTPLRVPLQSPQTVVHGDTVYLLGYGGALVAVDTRTSAQRWRLETAVTFASAPVVTGGRLYFSAADGRLFAVDTARGRLLGQTRARPGGKGDSVASSLPAPIAADGKVFATAPDGSLFAVDARRPADW
ncbi:serine/threonine-protein kinase [Streptomyces sp. NPDC052051]|uniref:serine/threonine-protein kinase n=1 Tax=Streptomyces sp. NPDC052051 TaxID=3154649 RepID=UPI00342E8373